MNMMPSQQMGPAAGGNTALAMEGHPLPPQYWGPDQPSSQCLRHYWTYEFRWSGHAWRMDKCGREPWTLAVRRKHVWKGGGHVMAGGGSGRRTPACPPDEGTRFKCCSGCCPTTLSPWVTTWPYPFREGCCRAGACHCPCTATAVYACSH